jgi:TetR/AcrR family transcriptional regulator, copper-responsive repressor
MGRPKTWERSDVLRKAARLFWEKGFEGAHLQELVDVTGLNRFALYKEFGGKEGLFHEALQSYISDLGELGRILGREPRGLENVRDFFQAADAYNFHHGCFVLNTVREKSLLAEETWSTTREFVLGGEQQIRRNLDAAKERGQLARDTDTEGLARFLTALNIGLITYGVVAPDGTDRGRALAFLDSLFR